MCVYLFSALSRRVGALQIIIIKASEKEKKEEAGLTAQRKNLETVQREH